MRWIKSLVVVLAAMILVAVGLLGFGFYKRTSDPAWRLFGPSLAPAAPVKPAAPAAPPTADAAAPWGTIDLGLDASCRIVDVKADGPRLYLTIGPDAACHRVVIVDTDRGRVLGTVRTGP